MKYFKLAADQGIAGAQSNLGWCYANGKGVKWTSSRQWSTTNWLLIIDKAMPTFNMTWDGAMVAERVLMMTRSRQ